MNHPIKKSPSAPLLYLLPAGRGVAAAAASMNLCCNFNNLLDTIRRRPSALVLFVFLSVFLLASFFIASYSSRGGPIPISFYRPDVQYPSANLTARPPKNTDSLNHAIQEQLGNRTREDVHSVQDDSAFDSVSILFPDWEVLVIVSLSTPLIPTAGDNFTCLYPNKATSPARFSGILPFTKQATFKCKLPLRNRRRLPFLSPKLTRESTVSSSSAIPPPPKELLRWSFVAYDSFSTEDDVVLFVKGVNNRQGVNRSPEEFQCVFWDASGGNNTVKTAVASSIQEVFRCPHPDLKAFGYGGEEPIKLQVSLEIIEEKLVVPTVAYYTPTGPLKTASPQPRSELCACTMVYNVGKFLREWVMYHSAIGVERFLLYDNESDDGLDGVVQALNEEGYNVSTLLWIWPKTQEAGFSHAAVYAKELCAWMMFVDVDEYIFSPPWANSLRPSRHLIKSLIPKSKPSPSDHHHRQSIGEVSIKCNEFGPSNQRSNPVEGVTQGYNCRRRADNRHKSIVLLKAIDYSLLNVIHHFALTSKYKWKQLSLEAAVVNHYKYQAWSEFKAKFRRRVSAYVVDWRRSVNPMSKDRTPGLGFEPVEPPGWEHKFCEVRDDRLKLLTQKWFGKQSKTGFKMAWQ